MKIQKYYNCFEVYRNSNWQTFQVDLTECNTVTLINQSPNGTADINNGGLYIDAGQQLTIDGKSLEKLTSKISIRVIATNNFNFIVIKKVFIV
jgi:hypothetical protein